MLIWLLYLWLGLGPEIPRGVHDDAPLPRAWALVGGEVLWVCWDAREADCFVPISLDGGTGSLLELRFVDRSRLELGQSDGTVLSVTRGQSFAEPVPDPGAIALLSPRLLTCAPGGRAPRWTADGPIWIRCTSTLRCEPLRLRPRGRPSGLRAGLTLSVGQDTHRDRRISARSARGWMATASLALSFSARDRDRDLRLRDQPRRALAAHRCPEEHP